MKWNVVAGVLLYVTSLLTTPSYHPQDTKSDVILDVLSHMASTSAYQRLRTEQQLGYIVFAFLRRLNGGQGLSVVVQSPSASPPQLDGFIEVGRDGMGAEKGTVEASKRIGFQDLVGCFCGTCIHAYIKAMFSLPTGLDGRFPREGAGDTVGRRF